MHDHVHRPAQGGLAVGSPRMASPMLVERSGIDGCRQPGSRRQRHGWVSPGNEMHGIMERAEARGLRRRAAEPVPHIGIDDKPLCTGAQQSDAAIHGKPGWTVPRTPGIIDPIYNTHDAFPPP